MSIKIWFMSIKLYCEKMRRNAKRIQQRNMGKEREDNIINPRLYLHLKYRDKETPHLFDAFLYFIWMKSILRRESI